MNIFGFRPFKGRFNLGNSDDIPTNEDGTLIGAIKQINTHLSDIIQPVTISAYNANNFLIFGSAFILNDEYLIAEFLFNGRTTSGDHYLSIDTQSETSLAYINLPSGYSINSNSTSTSYQFAASAQGANYQHGHVDIKFTAGSGNRLISGLAASNLIREGGCTFMVPVTKT